MTAPNDRAHAKEIFSKLAVKGRAHAVGVGFLLGFLVRTDVKAST